MPVHPQPPPSSGDSATALTANIVKALRDLGVPPPFWASQKYDGVTLAIGSQTQLKLSSSFNCIISNLSAGQVNCFFGGSGTVPDFTFTASANPISITFPVRHDNLITLVVAGVASAVGVIHVVQF